MGAMVRHILSKNLLTDSPQLYRVLDAVTESLSVSNGLSSIPGLVGLANSFQDVPAESVMFYTVPWTAYPQDPNRIIWTDEAQYLWDAIAADRPILDPAEIEDDAASGSEDGSVDGGETAEKPDETSKPSG